VEVVRDLVRLHSDQRWLDLVRGPVQRLGVDAGELVAEQLDQTGEEMREVRAAPPHPVLPQPALGLVESERCGALER
jgi:hypothetical protein